MCVVFGHPILQTRNIIPQELFTVTFIILNIEFSPHGEGEFTAPVAGSESVYVGCTCKSDTFALARPRVERFGCRLRNPPNPQNIRLNTCCAPWGRSDDACRVIYGYTRPRGHLGSPGIE